MEGAGAGGLGGFQRENPGDPNARNNLEMALPGGEGLFWTWC